MQRYDRTLENRVAIVTGAGQGIGRAVGLRLASEGAQVVVNDLDGELARETAALIRKKGGSAATIVGNVAAEEFGRAAVTLAVDSFGGLDIIVNNAGYTWDAVVQKMSTEQFDSMLDVHLRAPFFLLRAAQPVIAKLHSSEAGGPDAHARKIVNISSVSGLVGTPGQSNYSAAKAGVTGLTKALAREWGRYCVNVNCVAFGMISTRLSSSWSDRNEMEVADQLIRFGVSDELRGRIQDQIPLRRPGTPEEAAGAIRFLCSPDSDYVTAHTLICDGGLM